MTAPQNPPGNDRQQPYQQPYQQAYRPQHQQPFQQPYGQPQQGPPSSGVRQGGPGRLVAGIAIGVIAAIVVGAVLVLTDVVRFGSDEASAGPDTTPISLPDELAGLQDIRSASEAASGTVPDSVATRVEHSQKLTVERYRQAFDGAAVAVRSYADADLKFMPTVIAVRAPSPGLVNGPVVDPADLGLAAPPSSPEVVADGDVECFVMVVKVVQEGEQVDPDDRMTSACRRADDAVTVYVHGIGKGDAGHQQMVELTNAAFDAVSGTAG